MSFYGIVLQDQILQVGQYDGSYMELMYRLQQGTGGQDVDYHLTPPGLVRFRDRIYVSNESEVKKTILREFHAKPYLDHLGYQKIMTIMNTFFHWQNLNKDLAEFVAIFLDFQQVKEKFKHPVGLLQPISIPNFNWEVISMDFITGFPRTSR